MGDGETRRGPDAQPGFLLWHVSLRWRALLTERLQPLGLTPAQFDVLAAAAWLERAGGPPVQREVAAQAGADPMMTSQVLRTLERRKLVSRKPDPEDRRVWRVAMTPRGLSGLGDAIGVVHAASREFFDSALGDVQPLVAALGELARRG